MKEQILYTAYYFIVFVILLWIVNKKKKHPLLSYIIGIWIFCSGFSVFFLYMYPELYRNISLLPYVFLHICFIISLKPIYYNSCTFENEEPSYDVRTYKYVMMFFIVISIIPFIENLLHVVSSYNANDTSFLVDTYDEKMYGKGLKLYWLSSIGRICNSLDGVFLYFIMFMPFVFLTNKRVNKYFILFSFIPVLNHLLFQLGSSGRGTITSFLIVSVFFLILYRKLIPNGRMKLAKVLFVSVGVFFVSLMSILTYARRDARNQGVDDAYIIGVYLAKSQLDFNENLWHIKKHTEGDNSFGFFKKMIGFSVPKDKNSYWHQGKIGVVPSLFYTYIGDWFMDFGPVVTLLIFVIFASYSNRFFRKKTPNILLQHFLFFVYGYIICMGWSINLFKTIGAMQNLIASVILLLIIQKVSQKQLNQS